MRWRFIGAGRRADLRIGALRGRSFETVPICESARSVSGAIAAGWRYAVEIRNAEFLAPDYFACLRAHRVTHVYNAWSRMPEISAQMAIPESRTADLLVARALLRRGVLTRKPSRPSALRPRARSE